MGNARQATVDWPYAGPAGWRIDCRQSWLARGWKGNERVQVSLQIVAPGSPLADAAIYSALDDGRHHARDGVGQRSPKHRRTAHGYSIHDGRLSLAGTSSFEMAKGPADSGKPQPFATRGTQPQPSFQS
jgi:hypothetical protein